MKNLTMFDFNGQSVRVITSEDGEPLFVARDVAILLGYADEADAINKHCKKAKLFKNIDSGVLPESIKINGLRSDTKLIPESDVYRLVMRSKLESAERFQDWVVEEVIPSIRKTGSYSLKPIPQHVFQLPTNYIEALEALVVSEKENQVAKQTIERKDQLLIASNEASVKAGIPAINQSKPLN